MIKYSSQGKWNFTFKNTVFFILFLFFFLLKIVFLTEIIFFNLITSCDMAIPSTQRPPDPLATPPPSNTHQTHTRHFTPRPEQKIDEQEAPHSEKVTVIYRLVRSVQSRPINNFFSSSPFVTTRSSPSFSPLLAFEEGDGHIYTLAPAWIDFCLAHFSWFWLCQLLCAPSEGPLSLSSTSLACTAAMLAPSRQDCH